MTGNGEFGKIGGRTEGEVGESEFLRRRIGDDHRDRTGGRREESTRHFCNQILLSFFVLTIADQTRMEMVVPARGSDAINRYAKNANVCICFDLFLTREQLELTRIVRKIFAT